MRPILLTLLLATTAAAADNAPVFTVQRAMSDFALSANPNKAHWKRAQPVKAAVNPAGQPAGSGDAFEFRALWTGANLYFLFICPFETLNLKPDPNPAAETNKLWEWDVTEVFVGSDFQNIHHYQEFQVSPQAEWVDLDIDRKTPKPEGGWRWNSSMKVAARIDKKRKVWYGEMMIPLRSIDKRPPQAGNELRVNIYRLTGAAPARVSTMWTPVQNRSHHTPEAFGKVVLGQ